MPIFIQSSKERPCFLQPAHTSIVPSAHSTLLARLLQSSLGFFVALGFAGCTTLSTQNDDPRSGPINGMLYYLPVGKLTIIGSFEEIAMPAGESQTTATSSTSSDKKETGAAETPTQKVTQLKLSLTSEVEADERAGVYYATPHANYMYEDDVHVKVNNKHLLDTGGVKTEDKTVEIVQGITSLASQIAGGRTVSASVNRQPFNYTFRPSVYGEYQSVRDKLNKRGITLTVTPEPVSDDKTVVIDRTQAKQLGENGLLFRPALAYNVYVGFGDIVANTQQFILPDEHRLYEMGYPRISFVKHDKQIGFVDGMLTDFHDITPSPILGFLGLPKAIIKSVLPVPSG